MPQHNPDKSHQRAYALRMDVEDGYLKLKADVDKLRLAFPRQVKFSRKREYTLPSGEVIKLGASVMITWGKPDGFYVLGDQLGKGGFSRVKQIAYRGKDGEIDQSEVVKVTAPKPDCKQSTERMIERESQAVETIDKITLVLRRLGKKDRQKYYMNMKKRGGKNLSVYRDKIKTLSFADIIDLLQKIHAAVRDFHAQGLVHGDIKLSNIMIDYDERGVFQVNLVDFAFANKHGERLSYRGTHWFIHPDLYLWQYAPANLPDDLSADLFKPHALQHKHLGSWVDAHALAAVFGQLLFKEKYACIRTKRENYNPDYFQKYHTHHLYPYDFEDKNFWPKVPEKCRAILIVLMKHLEGRRVGCTHELTHEQVTACLLLLRYSAEERVIELQEIARIRGLVVDDPNLRHTQLAEQVNKLADGLNELAKAQLADDSGIPDDYVMVERPRLPSTSVFGRVYGLFGRAGAPRPYTVDNTPELDRQAACGLGKGTK